MGTIQDKMTADLDLRGFASTTKKEYLRTCSARTTSLRTTGGRRWSSGSTKLDELIERRKRANAFDRYAGTVDPKGEPWDRRAKVLSRRDIVERISRSWLADPSRP